jgi:hypothetical protein
MKATHQCFTFREGWSVVVMVTVHPLFALFDDSPIYEMLKPFLLAVY